MALAALLALCPALASATNSDAAAGSGARQLKEASCDTTTFPALKAVSVGVVADCRERLPRCGCRSVRGHYYRAAAAAQRAAARPILHTRHTHRPSPLPIADAERARQQGHGHGVGRRRRPGAWPAICLLPPRARRTQTHAAADDDALSAARVALRAPLFTRNPDPPSTPAQHNTQRNTQHKQQTNSTCLSSRSPTGCGAPRTAARPLSTSPTASTVRCLFFVVAGCCRAARARA